MMQTDAQLAPAAGSGIGKLIADALLARPEFVGLMRDALIEGLKAMTPRRWDKDTQKFIADPDCRVRIQTVALVLSHMEGEPIKRIVHQHLGMPSVDPVAAMQDSPALVAAVERALENAKFRTRRQKPAQPGQPSGAETLDLA